MLFICIFIDESSVVYGLMVFFFILDEAGEVCADSLSVGEDILKTGYYARGLTPARAGKKMGKHAAKTVVKTHVAVLLLLTLIVYFVSVLTIPTGKEEEEISCS